MKDHVSCFEKVSDGYLFTVSDEVAKAFQESGDYGVTFVQAGPQKEVSAADVKKLLAIASNRSTLEGKATKVGSNQIKVVTAATVTIDLSRPYVTFWGLNHQRLQDILAGRPSANASCGMCYGVDGYREVKCTDPNSIVCCVSC